MTLRNCGVAMIVPRATQPGTTVISFPQPISFPQWTHKPGAHLPRIAYQHDVRTEAEMHPRNRCCRWPNTVHYCHGY